MSFSGQSWEHPGNDWEQAGNMMGIRVSVDKKLGNVAGNGNIFGNKGVFLKNFRRNFELFFKLIFCLKLRVFLRFFDRVYWLILGGVLRLLGTILFSEAP